MANFKKLFLSAAMLIGIGVVSGSLTTQAVDTPQEPSTPAELTENFTLVQDFDYSADGIGTIGGNNSYGVVSVAPGTNLVENPITLVQESNMDAIQLSAERVDSSQANNSLAVTFRSKEANLYSSEENKNCVIKIRFKTENQGGNAIDFCLMFKANTLGEKQTADGRYQFRMKAGTTKTLEQGRYPTNGEASWTKVDNATGKIAENQWRELTFVLEDNGSLDAERNSPDKMYYYLDGEFLGERNFAKNDDYNGTLSSFYYFVPAASTAYKRITKIDSIKVGPYNGAVATAPNITEVKKDIPFSLEPTLTTDDADHLQSISGYNINFSLNEIDLTTRTENGAIIYSSSEKDILKYENGKYIALELVENLKATYTFKDKTINSVSVTFKVVENEEPILVDSIASHPMVKNDTLTISKGESYDLSSIFQATPSTAANTGLSYSLVEDNGVLDSSDLADSILTTLKTGEAKIKIAALDASGVERTITVKVVNGAYDSLNNYTVNDTWTEAEQTINGYTIKGYGSKTFAQAGVVEDAVFGTALVIRGNGGANSSGSHLDKHISLTELGANKDIKLTGWIKLSPEAAAKASSPSVDIKLCTWKTVQGGYSYGNEDTAYGFKLKNSDKTKLVNGWVYFETDVINLDTNAINGGWEGIKIELALWNGEEGIDAYFTHLALVEVDGVKTVGWDITNSNNVAIDSSKELTLQAGSEFKINAVAVPSAGSVVATFSSSDETIATVNAEGLVTILDKVGKVTITVAVGNETKSLTINVVKTAQSITMESSTIEIILNKFDARRAIYDITVTPADATSELEVAVANDAICNASIVGKKLYITNPALGTTTLTISAKDNPEVKLVLTIIVKDYNVTYNVNGHGETPTPLTNVVALPTELPELTAEGFVFGGWYTDANCTVKAVAGATLTEDVTLYAKWVVKEADKFTVTYDLQGHGASLQPVVNVTTLPTELPIPTATGFKFGGWYTNADCTIKAVAGSTISEDTTLYAKWIQAFTITFNVQGHGIAPAVLNNVTAIPAELPVLTAEGYVFGGWYTDANCTTKVVEGTELNGNITLYAKWTEKVEESFTITFNNKGHGTTPDAVKGSKLPDNLPVLSELGWTFEGWYLDENCTTEAKAGQSITADTTLYAKWTEKAVTPPTPTTPEEPTGLSAGAIAGIIIGVVAALGVAGGLTFYFLKKKQTPKQEVKKDDKE